MTHFLNHLRLVTGFGLLLSVSAVAQTRYCLGGDLEHLSASQRSACSAKVEAVRKAAVGVPMPADWHFVVVCGEQGWKDYAIYAFASSDALQDAQLSTDHDRHETFLRESSLHLDDVASLRQILTTAFSGESPASALAFTKATTHPNQGALRPSGL